MAFPNFTVLAGAASVMVAVLALAMAVLGAKSYRATGNRRLLFVVAAFALYVVKSLFVGFNVLLHGPAGSIPPENVVAHDAIEFFSALFDVGIVVLFFVPFVMPDAR